MGLFSSKTSSDKQKEQKFREFEDDYSDSPKMLASSKAIWLTSRANHNGQTGDMDGATKDFKEAIKINPYHCPAYLGLAVAYRIQEMFDEAIDILEQAPKTTPNGEHKMDNRFVINYHLGFVYMEKGDKNKTVKAFEDAIKAWKTSLYQTTPDLFDEDDVLQHQEELNQIKDWVAEYK